MFVPSKDSPSMTSTRTLIGALDGDAATTRVHSTTDVVRGSPEATPCGNANVPRGGAASGPASGPPLLSPQPATFAATMNAPAPRRKSLLRIGGHPKPVLTREGSYGGADEAVGSDRRDRDR